MIIPMKKVSLIIYHADYQSFLQDLQTMGILHVETQESALNPETHELLSQIQQLRQVNRFLERITPADSSIPQSEPAEPPDILQQIQQKQIELERATQKKTVLEKEVTNLTPWGDFSPERFNQLKELQLKIRFFSCNEKKFDPEWSSQYPIEIIGSSGNQLNFVLIHPEDQQITLPVDEIKAPERSIKTALNDLDIVKNKIQAIQEFFNRCARDYLQLLRDYLKLLESRMVYKQVEISANAAAENHVMVLAGWIPANKLRDMESFLSERDIVYLITNVEPGENPPIQLKNNSFSRLFEPIGKLFSLPNYMEQDLTASFAPFFTLFFGFCLGDAGYGLLILLATTAFKFVPQAGNFKPFLSLGQILALATIAFGLITGTVFGVNLAEVEFLDPTLRAKFLTQDSIFQLALIIGVIQIAVGMVFQIINRSRQFGFKYAIPIIGWLLIIFALPFFMTNIAPLVAKGLLAIGGLLALSTLIWDPAPIMPNPVANGVFVIYSTVTGFFGDVLSYIRLFALGVSSGILGLVINSIGSQMFLKIPLVGPVIFAIFLVIGHIGNLLLSSLGSFVHPMRLTFVEFYKNAGFAGGGKPYTPFAHK